MIDAPADLPPEPDGTAVIHKRRVRYQGTHPKRFEEKYKELDPIAHALPAAWARFAIASEWLKPPFLPG